MIIDKAVLDVFITKFLSTLKDANISSNKDLEGITERDLPISWEGDDPECVSIIRYGDSNKFTIGYDIGSAGTETPFSLVIDEENYEVMLRCRRIFEGYQQITGGIPDIWGHMYQMKKSFGGLSDALEELARIKVLE